MKLLLGVLGVVSLLLLVSCGTSSTRNESNNMGGGLVAPTSYQPQSTQTSTIPETGTPPQYSGALDTLPEDRMIVRTGRMSLVVEDVTIVIDRIAELAESNQGYVVSSNSWRDGERLRGNITIRVPANDFGNVMKLIGDMAVDITSQTTTSQDVTEEYVDLTAKLQTLEATEQQLLLIMEKAEKVEDVLAVQRELTNTRSEIEQTKGRMQYLEKTSTTSLIEVSLEQSKLDATFNVDRRFIKSGESVRFTSKIAGGFTPYSYQWSFGDGKTSNEASPSHVYRGAGEYSITLVVTDDRGNTATETMKDYVTVAVGWSAGNIAGSAWNGLAAFGRALASIGIWLGIFSPVWIIVGGIVYWQVRRRKKA